MDLIDMLQSAYAPTNEPSRLSHLFKEGSFLEILESPRARLLLKLKPSNKDEKTTIKDSSHGWPDLVEQQLSHLLETKDTEMLLELLAIGLAALYAFLQSNVTGPVLPWKVSDISAHSVPGGGATNSEDSQRQIIAKLSVDGEAIYQLAPQVELFYLAKCVLTALPLHSSEIIFRFARIRMNLWHARLLQNTPGSLTSDLYSDLKTLQSALENEHPQRMPEYLLERACIEIHHGHGHKAVEDLREAARLRDFSFALTGKMGKRTQWQQKDTSQLVVLAASSKDPSSTNPRESIQDFSINESKSAVLSKPQVLALNDDTLLESIAFEAPPPEVQENAAEIVLPPSLASLDPRSQPQLEPLDAAILLCLASSINENSPKDDLTREEMLPYADRVIKDSKTNWQIYTVALVIRSRLQAHRSRTLERSVLQVQALVDQIKAETTSTSSYADSNNPGISTFLPKASPSESAPASDRLQYINVLPDSYTWDLEGELARLWLSIGGVRSALDIYERLEQWPEVALCYAASDREHEALAVINRQLFEESQDGHHILSDNHTPTYQATKGGQIYCEKKVLPADAPRLYCILGDIQHDENAYQRAWSASEQRYARAQRSIAALYLARKDFQSAEEALVKSLKMEPSNFDAQFKLGFAMMVQNKFSAAADAFRRALQIDSSDFEAFSNLGACLAQVQGEDSSDQSNGISQNAIGDPENRTTKKGSDAQSNLRQSLIAFKRAALLNRDSSKAWQNILSIAVRISPPPLSDIVIAQARLIELQGKLEREACVDVEIVEALVSHLINTDNEEDQNDDSEQLNRKSGLNKMILDLVLKKIVPLITTSRRLWSLVAKLQLHQRHPAAALSAFEKAWRATTSIPGWDTAFDSKSKFMWEDVVDSTIELVDAYHNLGQRPREAGLSEGTLVSSDWRFKSRSSLRTIIGKAKEAWEGSDGYQRLQERLAELRATPE